MCVYFGFCMFSLFTLHLSVIIIYLFSSFAYMYFFSNSQFFALSYILVLTYLATSQSISNFVVENVK